MKLLVTGGSGFIGRYVVKRLLDRGHNVVIADVTSPAFKGATFRECSMLQTAKLESLIQHSDGVMHLAGMLGTAEMIDDPVMPTKVNVMGSLTLFEVCRRFSKRCCYIAVGNHFMLNTYAISKTCAERYALMYNIEHNTKFAVVRGLNAYGPGQKHKPVRKVIPNFVLPAIRNEPITIYGSGDQVMDFIFVDDVAEILCRALLDDHGCYDTVIEAGSGRRTTINHIAERVIALAESDSEVIHQPMRPGEIPGATVVADTATLKPLGFAAGDMVELDDGLTRTIDFYRQHILEYA